MAFSDRVRCTTATTGTGDLTLSTSGVRDAINGDCLAPAETIDGPRSLANRLVTYFITCGNTWARGRGTISGNGLTLTRDPLEWSWSGADFTQGKLVLTGTSTVTINVDADDLSAGSIGISIALSRGIAFL